MAPRKAVAAVPAPKPARPRPRPDDAFKPTKPADPPAQAASQPPAAPPQRVAGDTPAEGAKLYGELEKLTGDRMALGAGRDLPLPVRIKALKEQRFDHGKTKFPLTGKHVRADCADCHKTKLEGTARDCVACHRQDDVHRGRRPDCARCHTTNNWHQIVRRR